MMVAECHRGGMREMRVPSSGTPLSHRGVLSLPPVPTTGLVSADSMCTFGLDYPMHGVPGSSNKVEDDPSTGDEGRGRQLAKAPEKPKKAACCPDTCINTAGEYQCGGENCEHIKGGPNSCCVQDINAKGESCNDPHVHGPPCSIRE